MRTDLNTLEHIEQLSPFEIKDKLITLAQESARKSAIAMLNAGRGNPNWVATTPREAFFTLGHFAVTECRRVMELDGIGGMPRKPGCADRLKKWCDENEAMPGADFLRAMVPFAVTRFGFDADAFVHELTDSIIGDNYPVPDRCLVHNEKISHAYLMWAMCGGHPPQGKIRPVSGGRRHRGDVLHVQDAQNESPAAPRRHHRPRHADLHAVSRNAASGGLRLENRQRERDAGEPFSIHR